MKRQEIVDEARRFVTLKAKWSKMGRQEHSMDCYGMIILVRKKFNLPSEDDFRYGDYPQKDLVMPVAQRMFTQVNPPLKDGQMIAFQFSGHPWHLGITATDEFGRRTVIHCSVNNRKTVEEPFEGPLAKNFRACFDFPGVED